MNYGTRTPEEWRAAVAELVLGWTLAIPGAPESGWRDSNGYLVSTPRPDLSADDDYRVLEHVRANWREREEADDPPTRRDRFNEELERRLAVPWDYDPPDYAETGLWAAENSQ